MLHLSTQDYTKDMNNIFDYTLASLTRYGFKNILIVAIFGFLVFLISSVIMITNSLKYEYKIIQKELPDIILQKNYGGKSYLISDRDIEFIWNYSGISSVEKRVWGQYHLINEGVYFSVYGVDPYSTIYNKEIQKAAMLYEESLDNSFIASKALIKRLDRYIKTFNAIPFYTPDRSILSLKLAGVYNFGSSLENNDVILVSVDSARKILGIKDGYYSDILLNISNPHEVDFIADKIMIEEPTIKAITKKEILKEYELLYDFKSGWFLMGIFISFVTFAIILYEKVSGIRSEEKRELGILKALGWEISHVITYKLLESLILSVFAFFIGFLAAMFYVYVLGAVGIRGVFTGYESIKHPFDLIFVMDFKTMIMLFLMSVPLFVAVSIVPAWKIATSDALEVIK